jgi:hypothetical protein
MHEPYDEDEDYDDDYNDQDSYKHYFKFDPAAWDIWGQWLYGTLHDMVESSPNVWYIGPGFDKEVFPVNSYFSNTGKDQTFQYLGNNYQNAPIWKKKYFVHDKLQTDYINHIKQHSLYFVQQPHYYRGLFDILN